MSRSREAGFTIVELLVVIAILMILVSLMLPSLDMSREAAHMAQCNNNMHNIGIAYHNFRVQRSDGEARELPKTWTTELMPYLADNHSMLVCPKDPNAVGYAAMQGEGQVVDGGNGPPGGVGANDPGGGAGNGGNQGNGGGDKPRPKPKAKGDLAMGGSTPRSLQLHRVESKRKVRVYKERSNYVLPNRVRLEVSKEGMFNGAITRNSPTVARAGAEVDVWLLHWDPKGRKGQTRTGRASFTQKVIGVAVTTKGLGATDDVGKKGTRYYKGAYRGLEKRADTITISSNRKTVTVNHFYTPGWMEQVRVLTEPEAPYEPPTSEETGGDPWEPDGSVEDGEAEYYPSYAMNRIANKDGALRPDQFLLVEYHGKPLINLDEEIEHGFLDEYLADPHRSPARHFGKLHVLMLDGSVQLRTPEEVFDPESTNWLSRLAD